MSAFQQSKQQQNALRGPVPSLYFQDTYRASPQLTVTGGLRWAPNFMPVDVFNRGVEFSMAAFLANQVSTVYPNAPAGARYYGDPGVSRQFTKNSPWQFSPNFGFSFDPSGNGKTVLRGGFSLNYDQVNFFTAQRNQQNPPFATAINQTQTSTSGPLSFSSPWSIGQVNTSPFPQPQIPTPAQAQFFAQSQFIVQPAQFHASYTQTVDGECAARSRSGLAAAGSVHRQPHGARTHRYRHSARRRIFPEYGVQVERDAQVS